MRFRNIIEQIENINELDKVSYFVDGLKGTIQRKIVYQVPVTFEEAWKLVIKFDIAMFGLGKPTGYHQDNYTLSRGKQLQLPRKQHYNDPMPMELNYTGTVQGNYKRNY